MAESAQVPHPKEKPAEQVAVTSASYEKCLSLIEPAAAAVFGADPRVRALGIAPHPEGLFGFAATRNVQAILPQGVPEAQPVRRFETIPVTYNETFGELSCLTMAPALPLTATQVPETLTVRPLVCGLQIQNHDYGLRTAFLPPYGMSIGTLGCLVQDDSGSLFILSNTHVLAPGNQGQPGDAILQPGTTATAYTPPERIARLKRFIPIQPSPVNADPSQGNAVLNEVDAGIAELEPGIGASSGFLPHRRLIPASGTNVPDLMKPLVWKVGRTTGLTLGEIKKSATIVGPIAYPGIGLCWFRNAIEISDPVGTHFSNNGDSGSAILNRDGEVIGLLFAGNGDVTYACPIESVLSALGVGIA
ncbi:MAG: hypothetical protein ABUT39_13630 [Acidobacteriota bacterium]